MTEEAKKILFGQGRRTRNETKDRREKEDKNPKSCGR
jgi:hypothetical protein